MSGNNLQGILAGLMGRLGGNPEAQVKALMNNPLIGSLPALIGVMSETEGSELNKKITESLGEIVDILKEPASPRLRDQLSLLFSSQPKNKISPDEKMKMLTAMLPSLMETIAKLDKQQLAKLNTKINAILPDIQKATNKDDTSR